jgi:glucose/arabinose dehydrogenase
MRNALRMFVVGLLLSATVVAADAHKVFADAPPGFTSSLVLGNLQSGLGGLAVGFAYARDGRIFIARKTGVIDVWDNGVQHVWVDMRNEVNSVGARGMLGLVLDPAFSTNHRVFLMFTQELDPANPDSTETAGGEIISLRQQAANPDAADLSTRVTLLSGYPSTSTEHTIGDLHFDAAGMLLASTGDGADLGVLQGQAMVSEDLNDLRGKILRIDPNSGLGVPGNPYFDAGLPDSVRSKVFARGFRNPYRFSIDPDNGTVYVGNVGWNTWEMLNAFPTTFTNPDKDRNGGWPCYEGGNGVALPQPLYEFAPATQAACEAIYSPAEGGTGPGESAPLYGYRHDAPGGENGSAITAGPKYVGTSNYPAQYVGQLFIGDYARDRFQNVDPTTGVATDFGIPGNWGNPVDIQIAPDGNVAYLAISTGELREIVFTGSNHVPVAVASATQTSSATAPFNAQLIGSGSSDADPGDTLSYDWNFQDGTPDSHLVNPTHNFVNAGSYDVTLTVSDGHPGGTVETDLWIDVANTPPTVSLLSPSPSFRYAIGDTINLHVDAQDTQDGPLPDAQISTQVRLIHLDHFHPITDFTGRTASFVALDHGSDFTFYEIITTATDDFGRTTTSTFDILPNKQPVTISSTPPGVTLSVDGDQATTPYTFMSIVNEHHEIDAPAADLTVGNAHYAFNEWTQGAVSDNGEFYDFNTPPTGTSVNADYSPTDKGISISSASIAEGSASPRTVALDVSLSTPQTSPVTVNYATADGTGPNGASGTSDYTARSGTVTFAAGQTSKEVDISVKGDKVVEPDEHFSVVLSSPSGAPIVQGTGTVTILNDDPSGALQLSVGDVQVLEGDDGVRTAHVTVSLSAPSPGGVSVAYATAEGSAVAPGDYASAAGTLTFAAGTTAQTVALRINGDGEFEPSEALALNLSNAIGAVIGRSTATIKIANDDAGPALSISNVSTVEGNSGTRTAFFTIGLSTPSTNSVNVAWTVSHQTTNGGDIKIKTGTATITPGNLFATVQVTTYGDTAVEPNENYHVTLSNPVNATIAAATATGTVLNDDPSSGLKVTIGDTASYEGNAGSQRIELTVNLSDPAASDVTVNYATAPGTATKTDFVSKHGTLTIKAGATTGFLAFVVHGDAAVEPNESFTVTISNPTGGASIGRATGTTTILNDD